MTTPNDRKHAKAAAIVQAALGLFSRKGYPLTSIEQISEEAGIGKSTVYEYFPTKEALFEAAINTAAEDWIDGMLAVGRQTDDAVLRLRRIADQFIAYHKPQNQPEQGLFIEVLSQTLREGGVFSNRPHVIHQIYRRVVHIVVGYLLDGVSSGQFRPEIAREAEGIAVHFLATLDGIQLHSMIAPTQVNHDGQVAFFLDQLTPYLLTPAQDVPAQGVRVNIAQ
jgi:AcrR family transcriptional regulator